MTRELFLWRLQRLMLQLLTRTVGGGEDHSLVEEPRVWGHLLLLRGGRNLVVGLQQLRLRDDHSLVVVSRLMPIMRNEGWNLVEKTIESMTLMIEETIERATTLTLTHHC